MLRGTKPTVVWKDGKHPGFRPACISCGHYLLPCTVNANGVHDEIVNANTLPPDHPYWQQG